MLYVIVLNNMLYLYIVTYTLFFIRIQWLLFLKKGFAPIRVEKPGTVKYYCIYNQCKNHVINYVIQINYVFFLFFIMV